MESTKTAGFGNLKTSQRLCYVSRNLFDYLLNQLFKVNLN